MRWAHESPAPTGVITTFDEGPPSASRLPLHVKVLRSVLGGEDKARCRRRCAAARVVDVAGRAPGITPPRFTDPNPGRLVGACLVCPKRTRLRGRRSGNRRTALARLVTLAAIVDNAARRTNTARTGQLT